MTRRRMAWAMAAMVWLMPFFLENISGGLARAFASPLLALFVLAALRAAGGMESVALTVQAAAIPYIFLPCAAAGLLRRAWDSWRQRRLEASLRPGRVWLVWLLPLALAWANAAKPQWGGFGPLVWLSETLGRPEFGPLGRLDLVPLPNPFLDAVYFPFERIGLFKEWGLFPGIASLCLLAPVLWYGGRSVDWRGLARSLAPLAWTGGAFLAFYVAAEMVSVHPVDFGHRVPS